MNTDLAAAEPLVDDSAVAIATSRDLILAVGPDAASYLHGQLSQNIEALAVGDTAWTLLLQPQGKVEAWLRVHRRSEQEFWLDADPGAGEAALARLERFKLRVEVEFSLRPVQVVALRGPRSRDLAAGGDQTGGGVVALDAEWGGIDGVDLFPASPDSPGEVADASAYSAVSAPEELLELIRIRQGRPAMGTELDESTIPAAAGVVERSVDFTKGCYVGQELVARVDSRGNNTPTKLHTLHFEGESMVEPGTELTLDGSAAGTVTSVARSPRSGTIGLGYLKRGIETPARLVVPSVDGDQVAVEVAALPQ